MSEKIQRKSTNDNKALKNSKSISWQQKIRKISRIFSLKGSKTDNLIKSIAGNSIEGAVDIQYNYILFYHVNFQRLLPYLQLLTSQDINSIVEDVKNLQLFEIIFFLKILQYVF